MAWPKGVGKGESKRFNVRLDDDTAAYFRRRAKESGVTVSELLRVTLHDGAVAHSLIEFGDRMDELVSRVFQSDGGKHQPFPDALALAMLTSEAILKGIVESQDPQALYAAQETARAKLAKLKGS